MQREKRQRHKACGVGKQRERGIELRRSIQRGEQGAYKEIEREREREKEREEERERN